jgi:hypothetical protein
MAFKLRRCSRTRAPITAGSRRVGRFLRAAAALVGSSLLLLVAPAPGWASGTPVSWPSGVFAGYGPAGDAGFGAWRGAPVQTATDYIGSDNWGQIEDPAWAISQWSADRAVTPDLSVALWPSSGGSLAEVASGADNAHFVALARNLVAAGLGGVGIRLGWEFNATWYRWSVGSAADAANFAAAWRQIVGAMRSVPGANFSFDWCPNLQAGGINPALAYPGDAYVTDIGMDVYDWNESAPNETPSQRWSDIVSKGYGLAWQASFAAAHHKPIAFAEWGLVSYAPDPARAGGDDPAFVQNMFDWFKSHNVAFENYFDTDAPSLATDYGISTGNGQFPNASALYQQLYTGQASASASASASARVTPIARVSSSGPVTASRPYRKEQRHAAPRRHPAGRPRHQRRHRGARDARRRSSRTHRHGAHSR